MLGKEPVVVAPAEGKLVWLGSRFGVHFKIAGKVTGGSFSIVEHPIKPGELVTPHVHTREDELSYVIEGEIGVQVGDREFQAGPGCYIFKPRGVPHTFWNAGTERARLIEIISPAGFEKFFEELVELYPAGGGSPEFQQVAELATRYGLTFQMDWVPALMAKYNVKLRWQQ